MRRPLIHRLVVAPLVAAPLLLVALGGCRGAGDGEPIVKTKDGTTKKPRPDDGKKRGPEPKLHRASATECAPGPTRGDVEARDAGSAGPSVADPRAKCKADAECTAGKNGRCAITGGGRMAPHADCVYDACFKDADCGERSACSCGGRPGAANRCVGGNCATDADCGGGYCSPSYGTSCGPFGGYAGNFCHTADDECTSDDECGEKKGQRGYCAWFPEIGHWKCGYSHCVG